MHIPVIESLRGIAALSMALVTAIIILTIPQFNPALLKRLERQSYSLYLIHGTLGTSAVNILMKHLDSPAEKVVIVLFATTASIAAAEVLFLCVEAPSHRWSKRVKLS